MKRKICVVTGSRADYGILFPLLEKLRADKNFRLQLVATGSHLEKKFGKTVSEIKKDFSIAASVPLNLKGDSSSGITKAMGKALSGFAAVYERLRPDLVVILGDRYEILCAAAGAMMAKIPIAHIHGGEVTEASLDDSIRHAITKISHFHFVSAVPYGKRVIQMGEEPKNVFVVGALGIDNIKSLNIPRKSEVEKMLNLKFMARNLLVTLHPETTEKGRGGLLVTELLEALSRLKETGIIFTAPNADENNAVILDKIKRFLKKSGGKARLFVSLGRKNYLSVMKYVDAVVGNSSSGIIEAPEFKVATVNIGDRQKGRVRASSVIDCEANRSSIYRAIKKAISVGFRDKLKRIKNVYGSGKAAEKITAILKIIMRNKTYKRKSFYDLRCV